MRTRPQTTPATMPPIGAEEVDVDDGDAEGACEAERMVAFVNSVRWGRVPEVLIKRALLRDLKLRSRRLDLMGLNL
jgi:hypothetical protein